MTLLQSIVPDIDRRETRRYFLSIKGRMVAPFEDVECTLINISEVAAKVSAECDAEKGDRVALEIDGLGCYRGQILRGDGSEFIIKFDDIGPGRRDRMAQRITDLLKNQFH